VSPALIVRAMTLTCCVFSKYRSNQPNTPRLGAWRIMAPKDDKDDKVELSVRITRVIRVSAVELHTHG
jgi:hypothetical protein